MSDIPRLEQGFADLRREILSRADTVDNKISMLTAQVLSTQAQIAAHIAVCDERQRQIEHRQEERRRWEQEQADEFRVFMNESRADRQAIRDSVQLNGWRILVAVIMANIVAALGTILASKTALLGALH